MKWKKRYAHKHNIRINDLDHLNSCKGCQELQTVEVRNKPTLKYPTCLFLNYCVIFTANIAIHFVLLLCHPVQPIVLS